MVSLLAAPVLLANAFWRYPQWWVEVMLRARMAVLHGQTSQRRLARTPPGEVVARSMDADRYARYADRWVDFVNGLIIAGVTALLAGTWMAGAVLLAVMVASALASTLGRPSRAARRPPPPQPGLGSAAPSSRRWTPRAPSSWPPPSPRSMPTCARWTQAASLRR